MLYSLFSELVTGPDWLHKYLTTEEFRLKTELGKCAHFRATAPLVHGQKGGIGRECKNTDELASGAKKIQ